MLKDRHLTDVVLIDNNAVSFGYQLDNGVPIISWYSDPNDRELWNLIDYLKLLNIVKDVRQVNRHTFRLNSYYEDFQNEHRTNFDFENFRFN
jgi:CTD small phosphatase-like protein 2